MEAVTAKFPGKNHPEIHLEFDAAIPRDDVASLVSFLEESVESGARYENGQLIELGSMILRFVSATGGLGVQEPDLRSVPIAWKAGVTQSLKLLRLQKDVAESVGLGDELDFPTVRQSLIVGTDLNAVVALVLERLKPVGSDSGWFLGRLDSELDYNEATNLRRISVYEAILRWPRIAGFLALPSGSRVETSSEGLEISCNGNVLEIREGSFLARDQL